MVNIHLVPVTRKNANIYLCRKRMKENKKIVAHYWRLIINPDDRFEITKKGKAYLRNEKVKESVSKIVKRVKSVIKK